MATQKKKTAIKKAVPKPAVDWKFEMEGITDRLDIMIQQLDAIRQHVAPPKDSAKEKK